MNMQGLLRTFGLRAVLVERVEPATSTAREAHQARKRVGMAQGSRKARRLLTSSAGALARWSQFRTNTCPLKSGIAEVALRGPNALQIRRSGPFPSQLPLVFQWLRLAAVVSTPCRASEGRSPCSSTEPRPVIWRRSTRCGPVAGARRRDGVGFVGVALVIGRGQAGGQGHTLIGCVSLLSRRDTAGQVWLCPRPNTERARKRWVYRTCRAVDFRPGHSGTGLVVSRWIEQGDKNESAV